MSLSFLITLCPWPDELIIGLTTQGIPTFATASSNSVSEDANIYFDVLMPSSSAAKRLIPSRFIVSHAALAVGVT